MRGIYLACTPLGLGGGRAAFLRIPLTLPSSIPAGKCATKPAEELLEQRPEPLTKRSSPLRGESGISGPAREAYSLGCGPTCSKTDKIPGFSFHFLFMYIRVFFLWAYKQESVFVEEKNVEWNFFTLEIHTDEFKWQRLSP